MGRFPQDGNYGCFGSLLKNLCWTAVVKPDLLPHFFRLFCGEHDHLITLPQPNLPSIHYNALLFIKNAPKMHNLSDTIQCNLNALQCILVHCLGVEAEVV